MEYKMHNTEKRLKLIACQDDESIIERMKAVGVWANMQDYIEMGGPVAIIHSDELFIWHNTPGDSGYSFFKSAKPGDLLFLAAMASNSSLAEAGQVRH